MVGKGIAIRRVNRANHMKKYVGCCVAFECKMPSNAVYELMSEVKGNENDGAGGLVKFEIC